MTSVRDSSSSEEHLNDRLYKTLSVKLLMRSDALNLWFFCRKVIFIEHETLGTKMRHMSPKESNSESDRLPGKGKNLVAIFRTQSNQHVVTHQRLWCNSLLHHKMGLTLTDKLLQCVTTGGAV